MTRTWGNSSTNRKVLPARKRVRPRLTLELLEVRCLLSDFRTITGLGNNVTTNPTWGQSHTDLLRAVPAAYGDGLNTPAGASRPSARVISNAVSDQTDPGNPAQDLNTINSKLLSDFIYVFGQFLDHDLDLTSGGNPSEVFNIAANQPGDPFNPPGFIPFTRSEFDSNTGKVVNGVNVPREQLNDITAFIDGSQIYGSDDSRASALRTHVGGLLKTSPGNLLPFNNATYFGSAAPLPNANDAHIVADSALFVGGDVRANENIELTAMQTLFMREHNRVASQIAAAHPTYDDETIYQLARRWVGAELQVITYTEWLPALLGPNALPAYTGYDPTVNPSIANEFSTAMFRFAHSQLDNGVDRLKNDGTDAADGSVDLAQAFFNPTLINANGVRDPFSGHVSTGIGAILKGAASGDAQEVDLLAVRDVRNLLFGPPGSGGSDLIARDLQRGRDHGLADYNTIRAAYGLPKVTSFFQITSNAAVAGKLQSLYGSVDNIDAFVGALAEDHVPGADVGPLTKAVLVDQFRRLRDGDRFFYLNQFSGAELQKLLATTTLAKVIQRNTAISNLQDNVFFFKDSMSGTVYFDFNRNGVRDFFESGLPGFKVNLLDDAGRLLSTTTTDQFGHYEFNNFNGAANTGKYNIRLVVPAGLVQTSVNPPTILISRGDIDVDGINLGVNFALGGAAITPPTSPLPASDPGLSNAAVANVLAQQPQAPAGTTTVVTVSAPPVTPPPSDDTGTPAQSGQTLTAATLPSAGDKTAAPTGLTDPLASGSDPFATL